MSIVLAITMILAVLVAAVFLWTKISHDAVGRRQRTRRQPAGLHSQVSEWLYWDARVAKPMLDRYAAQPKAQGPPQDPADRALHAIVLKEALVNNITMDRAYVRIKQRTKSPKARAFMAGQMGRAVRLHWRSRFHGPDGLFVLWFYLVAGPRHGRRHLFLETISSVLKEMSNV